MAPKPLWFMTLLRPAYKQNKNNYYIIKHLYFSQYYTERVRGYFTVKLLYKLLTYLRNL